MSSPTIERASAADMMELASATTPAAAQIGAILILTPASGLDLGVVRSALAERVVGVSRLRQRLQRTPLGCGRPIWIDDPAFDIANHVNEIVCPPPGDRGELLGVVAELVSRRLSPERPLWSATLVTGLDENAVALVLIFHHVLADGMGGLAVLANLVDGAPAPAACEFPRDPPQTMSLIADVMRARWRSLVHLPDSIRRVRAAAAELGTRTARAPRCSLNRPVGQRRRLAVVRTNLDELHRAAGEHGATINDAAVTAITGALARYLHERHEDVDRFVLSIPVSNRTAATADRLGNQVGVMLLVAPVTTGTTGDRLEAMAAATRVRKQAQRGASAEILVPVLRFLAAIRVLKFLTDHQRIATTFVTNLRGPEHHLTFLNTTVSEFIPVNGTSGNVGASFGVFSYAGTLTITVVVDAELAGELPELAALLQNELDELCLSAVRRRLRAIPERLDVSGTGQR